MKARNSPGIPVAAVGSSNRLSQLNSPYGLRSHASTPNNYQMSSLNPNAKSNQEVRDQDKEEAFHELPLTKIVNDLEKTLSSLSSKISSFDSSNLDDNIRAILEIDQDLKHQINELHQHQRLGEVIRDLEEESLTLNNTSRHILQKLIGFRAELKGLPSLPTKELPHSETVKDVNVDEILKYGMKLAKFTRIPPTSAASHPNNFVWPAEDSLRRGMLALASLKSDEILQNFKIGETKQVVGDSQIESTVIEEEQVDQPTSKISSKSRPVIEKPQEAASSLNLDLFDPENEDDSE